MLGIIILSSVKNLFSDSSSNFRYLSPFSIIANIIQSVGLGIIFYYIFNTGLRPSDTLPWFASSDRLPLFFGTAIFAIEGISVVSVIKMIPNEGFIINVIFCVGGIYKLYLLITFNIL